MNRLFVIWAMLQLGWGAFGCSDSDGVSSESTAALCDDGVDNDDDGATDCADAECGAFCEDTAPPLDWKTTWVSAQMAVDEDNMPPTPGLPGNTLRQKIQLSIGGESVRFTFSNEYGEAALPIEAVTVATSTGGSGIDEDTLQTLTFSGEPSVTITAGREVTSDPIDWSLSSRADMAISMRFGEELPQRITGHPGSRTLCYVEEGDAVSAPTFTGSSKPGWFFLSAVDVMTDAEAKAVVALGDSITDGYGSTTDGNDRWPDRLSLRLLDNEGTETIAVLNQGIGGNCLERCGLGPIATSRFDRDVLGPLGVEWVIILEGVNDLVYDGSVTAERMIESVTKMVDAAHEEDLSVIGGTIMPFGGNGNHNEEREAIRETFNEWVRTSDIFDGVIDFDEITRDSSDPTRLASEVDGGDGLHPGPSGYEIMADGIDLSLFEDGDTKE